ncbi:Disease resistance protein L6 [Linum perenne]
MSTSESKSSPSFDPAPLPLPAGEYEIFLSFRGPDVRQHFADHLYTYLVSSKIRTFRDEEELPKGEFLAPALEKAITESKIYIPIFSQNYASSKCCLQELAKMVECWRSGGGEKGQHIILPVFYFIDPRDVRHPDSGSYKEAFEQHGLNDHPPETILEWKEALQEVGKMKGWHITESDGQGAIIGQIFSKIDIHLRANYTLVTDELVGIDSHVEDVVKLLNLDSASEKIIGIHGMGGLGKTTLAKAVYNKVSTQFEGCCFLQNIKDTLAKKDKDGVLVLQNKIISDTLRKHSYEANDVKDVNDGIRVIRDRVSRQKLLIVLDDVDERFQFEDILGKVDNFSVDSRFIVTTRDTRVLELLQGCQLFELEEMSCDHSLKLFSKHAFGVNYPLEDYASLSTEFVRVATGLPLYLKVIGSLLFKKDKSFWKDKLIELKQIPPTEVQERLRISYNDLTRNQKQIFLDIACLFTGVYKEGPMHMWRDCDFHPTSAISTLVQRSLVKVDQNNLYWMHNHVRDLGEAIVREEHNQSPYKRSRISYGRDAIDLIKYKEGTNSVEALQVDMKGENLVLRNEHLKELSRLRYMLLWNARLSGSFKDVLPNIRWLGLGNCDSVPSNLNVKKLVVLQLEDCSVRDDWKGWNEIKVSRKLKTIVLCRCLNLNLVPDLSNCGDLQHLEFDECRNMLGELDISNLKNLKVILVSNTKITKLKGEIEKLQNLQYLDASNSSLIEVPAGISKLSSLEFLNLGLTPPNKLEMTEMLPNSLKRLTISSSSLSFLPSSLTFQLLEIESCPVITEIRGAGGLWESLPNLDVRRCSRLTDIGALHSMVNLESLVLDGIGLTKSVPSSLSMFKKLWKLCLSHISLEQFPDLSNLKNLKELWIIDCNKLIKVTGLHTLESLELLKELCVQVCGVLEKLPSLSKLTKLHKLEIGWCRALVEIHGVGELWDTLLHLSSLKNLRELAIRNCLELIEVTGLDMLELLELLELEGCRSIKMLTDLSGLVKLTTFTIWGCTQLTEVRGLGRLESLLHLWIFGCQSIKELPNLSGLKNLTIFHVTKCRQLKEVNGLEGLKDLEHLDFMGCRNMRGELDISNFKNLKMLRVSGCNKLIQVTGLDTLESLEFLSMAWSGSVKKLPDLSGLVKLKTLDVEGCTQLTEIRGLEKLELLEDLDVSSCESIKELPNLSGLKKLNKLRLKGCRQLKEVKGIEELDLLQVFEADKRLKVKYKLKRVSRYGKQLVTMERILFSVILAGLWGFFRLRKPTH